MGEQTLEEKIKLSEKLVDQHLDEVALTAAGVQAGTYAIQTAAQLTQQLKGFYDKKMAERKERERQKKEKQRMLASQKQTQANKNKPTP